ncbi:MAG: putative C-S lyase [Bacteroidetes bacterium]|jgi:cystathionine beta-lyase|nr:putative C-S lyase [Bacteroidota bacterium]
MYKESFNQIINRENTNCYKYDWREKIFNKKDVMPMWVADMDFPTPDFILQGIQERMKHPILGYSFYGDSLLESVRNWMLKRHDWEIEKEWIKLTPGVVPAINLAVLTFTQPGDKIIVQPPVYFPFFSAVKDHKRELVENELLLKNGRYVMDFDHLENNIDEKVKMLILCSPHNPTGNVWHKEELEQLVDICVRNNILIFSDEIHSDIIFKGNKHIPTATISDKAADITLTAMAPSKTFNMAGMASSVLIGSDKKRMNQFMREMQKFHIGMGNVLGHAGMEAAYTHGKQWLDEMMEYLHENLDFLKSFIQKNIPLIDVIEPEATYLIWLDCRKLGLEDKPLKDFFVQKAGLGLSDGPLFGKGGSGFQRINIACSKNYLEQALNNLYQALKTDNFI